jgi:hypothetical protein
VGDRQVMDRMPVVSLLLRVVWVAVRLLIVLMLIQQGTTFVYQGF